MVLAKISRLGVFLKRSKSFKYDNERSRISANSACVSFLSITKHARYRMKQRCGVGKRSAHRMAEKVYRLGVRHGETSGNLRKWVDAQYFYNRSANQIRLYGDKAYIFHNEKLITVIQIPHNLVPEVAAIRKFKEEKGGKKHESDRRTQKAG